MKGEVKESGKGASAGEGISGVEKRDENKQTRDSRALRMASIKKKTKRENIIGDVSERVGEKNEHGTGFAT